MGQSKTDLLERFAARAEDRPLLGRLLDLSEAADRRGRAQPSRFLDARQQGLAAALLNVAGRPYLLWGGYEEAERRVVVLLPDSSEPPERHASSAGIAVLRADTATRGLSHRDYLGALMGQRIERELIGDILVGDYGAQILACREIVPFLLQNFTGAGRARLTLSEISPDELRLPVRQMERRRDFVSSLRLDCVVACGFRLSRREAAEAVYAGRVLVDGLPCEKPDRQMTPGQMLTLRGKGRVTLEQVGGLSRKGRIAVTLLVW